MTADAASLAWPTRDDLTAALRTAARATVASGPGIRDLPTMTATLVTSALATVPGADGGGVAHPGEAAASSGHASAGDIADLDRLQSELAEGPGLDATEPGPGGGLVVAADLAGVDAERWPRFAPAAVAAGYRSVLSVDLSLDGRRRRALNLYARRADAFDATARATAGLFALQAAALLHGAEHVALLDRALVSRDVIGRAKGILMERFSLDDSAAFRMLVDASQATNTKLVDVAGWLVAKPGRRGHGPGR